MNENKSKKSKKGRETRGRPRKHHGGYSLLRTGKVPENRNYIRRYLRDVREKIIEDLGPTENDMSGVQLVLLDRLTSLLGCVRLMEETARENSEELPKHYLSFNNSVTKICSILGVEKKALDEGPDLMTYVNETYGKKGEEDGNK